MAPGFLLSKSTLKDWTQSTVFHSKSQEWCITLSYSAAHWEQAWEQAYSN